MIVADCNFAGLTPNIRVFIKAGDVDIILSSGGCPQMSGGGRKATPKEQELFDLWNGLGLTGNDVTGGRLNAFLKQARRIF